MSNQLPQGFQDLTHNDKPLSKKAHKLVSILFTGKCSKGRIKRIRTKKNKSKGYLMYLDLRIRHWKTKRLYSYYGTITRWNRH